MTSGVLNKEKLLVLADQMMVSGCAILTQFLVTGIVGLKAYGRFSGIALAQMLLLSIQQAGLTGTYQLKVGVKDTYQPHQQLSGVWTLQVQWLLLLLLAGLAALPFNVLDLTYTQKLISIAYILLFLLQDFLRRMFIAHMQMKKALIIDTLNNVLQVAALFAMFILHFASFTGILLVCAATFIVPVILGIVWLRPLYRHAAAILVGRNYFKQSSWLVGTALLQWLSGNLFIVAGGWWLGAATLGLLRLAQYSFGAINVVMQAIESYLLQRTATFNNVKEDIITYLRRVEVKMISLTLVLIAPTVAAALLVAGYRHITIDATLLQVVCGMSVLYVFIIVGYPIRIAIRALDHSHIMFAGYVLSAIFSLLSAGYLVKHAQVGGIMFGMIISQLVLLTFCISVLQRKFKVLWK